MHSVRPDGRLALTSQVAALALGAVLVVILAFTSSARAAEKFVFEAGSGEGQHAVFATEVGSNVYRLLAANARDPALSADGKTVAFVRHSGAYRLNADLVTMPFSGGPETVIRQMSLSDGWAEVDIDNPSFSPSGDEIA